MSESIAKSSKISESMAKCREIFAQGSETAGWNGCIIHDALYHINEWLKCYDMFITGLLPAAVGGFAVYLTIKALKETRENAQKQGEDFKSQMALLEKQVKIHERQEIANAWNILMPNSGKKEAIETLAKAGKSLDVIDLSRDRHGGTVDLWGVDLSGCELNNSKWNGADLREANFTGADLTNADFTGALYFEEAIFKDCWIVGETEGEAKEGFPFLPQGWKAEFVMENGKPKPHPNGKGFLIEIVKI